MWRIAKTAAALAFICPLAAWAALANKACGGPGSDTGAGPGKPPRCVLARYAWPKVLVLTDEDWQELDEYIEEMLSAQS